MSAGGTGESGLPGEAGGVRAAGRAGWVQAVGDRAFRLRSWTPLPVIAALVALLWLRGGEAGPGGEAVGLALDVAGVVVALLGQTLRFWTLGVVRDGSSGQDRRLIAARLNRTGPYAMVRNPLYVGNLGIVLGLLLVAHHELAYVLGLGFFFGSYFFVICAEEAFLRGQFGAEYDEFCGAVPRWLPTWPRASLHAAPMDVRRALRKEVNPFAAWSLAIVAIHAGERWLGDGLGEAEARWYGAAAAAILVLLAAVKAWKLGAFGGKPGVST